MDRYAPVPTSPGSVMEPGNSTRQTVAPSAPDAGGAACSACCGTGRIVARLILSPDRLAVRTTCDHCRGTGRDPLPEAAE